MTAPHDVTLRLVPIDERGSGEVGEAAARGAAAAETVAATLELYRRRGYRPPWIGYLAFEGRRCVGGCGFAGPPADGEVEIAYFTFPGDEGRGVASRMAAELLRTTRGQAEGLVYVAHTLPQDGPSTSILRRLGFRKIGAVEHPEDGTVWKWCEAGGTGTDRGL